MSHSLEVNSGNFVTEVIDASFQKPILIDFFATWCGPCQLLKPILEKLAQEYNFILAKVDIDKNPELASSYRVEGVPDVRIVIQGEIIPGFVGALTEVQIRQMLTQLNLKSEIEVGLAAIAQARKSQNVKELQQVLHQLLNQYPDRPEVNLEAAKFLVEINQLEAATQQLANISESDRQYYPQAQAVKSLIQFKQAVNEPETTELDRQYAQACRLTLAGEYEAALTSFLEIVSTSRQYRQDGARKAMLALFDLLGNTHPLTQEYRKQLVSHLY